MKYQVGQSLWWVPTMRRGTPRSVKVIAVGRKWLQLDNRERVDIKTMLADGGNYSSPGCCYPCEDDWKADVALHEAWNDLRLQVQRHCGVPPGVTHSQIENARRALFKSSTPRAADSREDT